MTKRASPGARCLPLSLSPRFPLRHHLSTTAPEQMSDHNSMQLSMTYTYDISTSMNNPFWTPYVAWANAGNTHCTHRELYHRQIDRMINDQSVRVAIVFFAAIVSL